MIQVNEQSARGDILAAARERGVSGFGSNVEILKRIADVDAANEDPLGLDDEPDQSNTPETPPAAATGSSPPVAAGGPDPAGDPPVASTDPSFKVRLADHVRAAADSNGKTGVFGGVFREEFPLGSREIDDQYHFHLITETQAAAYAAGHIPKGGAHIGHRVGYSVDGAGRRTVIYEVPIRTR
jgi:hypothetical protein